MSCDRLKIIDQLVVIAVATKAVKVVNQPPERRAIDDAPTANQPRRKPTTLGLNLGGEQGNQPAPRRNKPVIERIDSVFARPTADQRQPDLTPRQPPAVPGNFLTTTRELTVDEVDQFLRIMEATGDRNHANAIRRTAGGEIHTGALRAMLTRILDSTPPYSSPTNIVELEYLLRRWASRRQAGPVEVTQELPADFNEEDRQQAQKETVVVAPWQRGLDPVEIAAQAREDEFVRQLNASEPMQRAMAETPKPDLTDYTIAPSEGNQLGSESPEVWGEVIGSHPHGDTTVYTVKNPSGTILTMVPAPVPNSPEVCKVKDTDGEILSLIALTAIGQAMLDAQAKQAANGGQDTTAD